MSFFSSLAAERYDRKYSDRQLIRRIISYFAPQSARISLMIVTILVISGTSATQPWVVSQGLDLLQQPGNHLAIVLIPLAVLLLGVINWISNWLRRRLTTRAIADVVISIASQGFRAAANHDLSFYDEVPSGKVLSRITSDTQDFGQLIVIITDIIAQIIEALILGIVLVRINGQLALYMFAILPIVLIIAINYRKLARKVTQQGMRAMANVNSTIKETISGIAVAKNFRQETSIYADFDQANHTSYSVNIRRGLVLSLLFPTLNALGGMTSALLVYFGGLTVAQGIITAGSWYLFLLSLDRFLFPVLNIASFWTQIQNGLSSAERIFALIDASPAVIQIDQQAPPKLRGQIEFHQVCFHYKEAEPILQNFDLTIQPSETIAIVGHTGAGKSSIARLVTRFYEFQSGQILIDGLDIRTFDLQNYRKQLGIVSQIPFLFSGTVLENICYAAPETSPDQIRSLAHQIGEGEWLDILPEGLNTSVGERGARLSMGQRQLVALMRVLVQRPAIFILDEATASIDPFTEWQIQQALNLILARSTSILIAHRLSTVRSANRILVLEKGCILEQGSHAQLLAQNGKYSNLYDTYFRHQSLDYVEEAHRQPKNP